MEIIALRAMNDGRVAREFETEDFAIELHGSGHVKDLEERAEAVKVNVHGCRLGPHEILLR
jgi:hypothetical protein